MARPDGPFASLRDVRPRWLVLAAVLVAAMAVGGIAAPSGPESVALPSADRVVLVSIPGLQWPDLEASATPNIDGMLAGGSALLSVRAIDTLTTTVDGYLTLNAGNRLGLGQDDETEVFSTTAAAGSCTDVIDDAQDAAEDELQGAEAGALGDALHDAGRTTAAFGSAESVIALMDGAGCVDAAGDVGAATFDADVTIVELRGLATRTTAAERLAALEEIDAAIARLAVPTDAAVLLLAPSAPDRAAEPTVAGFVPAGSTGGDAQPWSLVSPTTRRADYVTQADVAPTVLDILGIDIPDAMTGTPIARSEDDARSLEERVRDVADLADLTEFRDRAVGPVSVFFTVFIVFCGFAAMARKARIARALAPFVVAIPTVAFLSGLVDYHRLPLDFYVLSVFVVAMIVAAVATASWSQFGPWAGTTALCALLWLVLVIDVVTGGQLQINTPLGYSATSAGRFQGFGNLAFALLAGASVAVAVIPVLLGRRDGHATLWAATVGVLTVIAVGAPAFGSDVGGTLALVPTFIVVVLLVSGRTVGWRRALLAAGAAVVVICVLAALDLARPADSRTHLGRFARKMLDGEAGLIIRRKIRGNLDILFATFWSFVLVAIFLAGAVLWWRSRGRFSAYLAQRPAVRAFVIGFVLVAFLGSTLNDSGVVIFGIMLGVMIPFVVAATVVPVPRGGR